MNVAETDRRNSRRGLRHPAPRSWFGAFSGRRSRRVCAGHGADRGSGRRRPADSLGVLRADRASGGFACVRDRPTQPCRVLAVRGVLAGMAGSPVGGDERHGGCVLRPARRGQSDRRRGWPTSLARRVARGRSRPDRPAGDARHPGGFARAHPRCRTNRSAGPVGGGGRLRRPGALVGRRRRVPAGRVVSRSRRCATRWPSCAGICPEVHPVEARREARREAFMRQTIRVALKAGRRRVAVVCGAWHAPALTLPLPPAVADARLLRGLPRRKVRTTWVPWTHSRLAYASGYGAGIASPGWYSHLWSAPDRPITRWLTRVAAALRTKDLAVSSAHVIESVRLAETLARLRGRPLAGLSEVQDATQSVLCDGSELMLGFVTSELVVGQQLGSVDPGVPTVPLEADLNRQCRTLRVRRDAAPRLFDLDLRKPTDRARSVLFHRLRVLGLDWIRPAESEVQGRGTFRETWQSQWRPEYALALVEAATWGTTVAGAATAKILDAGENFGRLRARRTGRADRGGRTLPAGGTAGCPAAAAGRVVPAGGAGRRRGPSHGGPAAAGPRSALRRRPRHRHLRPGGRERDPGHPDLRRPETGADRPGRRQCACHAATNRSGARCRQSGLRYADGASHATRAVAGHADRRLERRGHPP